jgi:hypothetical protein
VKDSQKTLEIEKTEKARTMFLDDGGMVFLGRCTIPGPAASEDLPPLS